MSPEELRTERNRSSSLSSTMRIVFDVFGRASRSRRQTSKSLNKSNDRKWLFKRFSCPRSIVSFKSIFGSNKTTDSDFRSIGLFFSSRIVVEVVRNSSTRLVELDEPEPIDQSFLTWLRHGQTTPFTHLSLSLSPSLDSHRATQRKHTLDIHSTLKFQFYSTVNIFHQRMEFIARLSLLLKFTQSLSTSYQSEWISSTKENIESRLRWTHRGPERQTDLSIGHIFGRIWELAGDE